MTQYAVGPQVTEIWSGIAGGSPVLLANQDPANSVTIARHSNIAIGGTDGELIPPLGSVAYTGDRTLYAIAPAGTLALLVIPGATQWAPPPAQVAQQLQPPLLPFALKRQGAGGSPYTVKTFAAASRIYTVLLTFAAATTAGQGLANLYAEVKTGSGITLALVELAVSAAGQAVNDIAPLALPNPVPVGAGDTIILDVNNAVALSNGNLRASCTGLYSSP